MKNFIIAIIVIFCAATKSFSQEKSDIYARNIIIVFDASGSMDDQINNGKKGRIEKLVAAKSAVRQVVDNLSPSTNVGLFVFGDTNNPNPVPIAIKDSMAINNALSSIRAGGGTPLGEYIQKAANQLLEQRQKNLGYGWYQLVVVTDGEATDREHMEQVATEVLKRGLSLDVIGVGMNSEHSLAKRSTSYRAANDTEALTRALEEVAAEPSVNDAAAISNDFALLAPINEDQAKAIIYALGNNENQPLFEENKNANNQVITSTIVSQNSSANASANTSNKGGGGEILIIAFAIMVIVFVIGGILKG